MLEALERCWFFMGFAGVTFSGGGQLTTSRLTSVSIKSVALPTYKIAALGHGHKGKVIPFGNDLVTTRFSEVAPSCMKTS
jgi:hypothetical protein